MEFLNDDGFKIAVIAALITGGLLAICIYAFPWLWRNRWYFAPFEIHYADNDHVRPWVKGHRYYETHADIWFIVRPRKGVELDWVDIRFVQKRGWKYVDVADEIIFLSDVDETEKKPRIEPVVRIDMHGGYFLTFQPPIKKSPADRFWFRVRPFLINAGSWSGYLSFYCRVGTERRAFARLPITIYRKARE